MEQNNSAQENENQSAKGTSEWLKLIVFFGAIILITGVAIAFIAPIIFADYVPTIMGLDTSTAEITVTDDSLTGQEEMPIEPLTDADNQPDGVDNDTATIDEDGSESASEVEIEPLPTEEENSSKVEEHTAETDDVIIYTVQYGETLTSIAAANQLTIDQLIAANHLINPNLLKAGQKINIPK